MMILGVDFDNTIVAYDSLFQRVARERSLIPDSVPPNKTAVRDFLRAAGQEEQWTLLQGHVYGARMAEAEPFPGVRDFFQSCRASGVIVRIISHKTRHPFLGEKHDLHAAARLWLEQEGFFQAALGGMAPDHVFFELTKEEKIARIRSCGCTHFVDDLPEILTHPDFPPEVARFLFDPAEAVSRSGPWLSTTGWEALGKTLQCQM